MFVDTMSFLKRDMVTDVVVTTTEAVTVTVSDAVETVTEADLGYQGVEKDVGEGLLSIMGADLKVLE